MPQQKRDGISSFLIAKNSLPLFILYKIAHIRRSAQCGSRAAVCGAQLLPSCRRLQYNSHKTVQHPAFCLLSCPHVYYLALRQYHYWPLFQEIFWEPLRVDSSFNKSWQRMLLSCGFDWMKYKTVASLWLQEDFLTKCLQCQELGEEKCVD